MLIKIMLNHYLVLSHLILKIIIIIACSNKFNVSPPILHCNRYLFKIFFLLNVVTSHLFKSYNFESRYPKPVL